MTSTDLVVLLRGVRRALWLVLAVTLLTRGIALAQPLYTVTRVEAPEFASQISPRKINAGGDVLCQFMDAQGIYRSLIWSAGTAVPTPVPAGAELHSDARDLNDRGQVVFSTWVSGERRSYITNESGGYSALPHLPGSLASSVTAMNNHGDVTGASPLTQQTPGGMNFLGYRAALWRDRQAISLELQADPPGYESAVDINDHGVVVGERQRGMQGLRPYRWQNGVIEDLPLPGEHQWGWATAINQTGQILGYAEHITPYPDDRIVGNSVIWTGGEIVSLFAPEGFSAGASDLNNAGVAVGSMLPSGMLGTARAVLWTSPHATDLNSLIDPRSGWELHWGSAINDSGWIIGAGTIHGQPSGFLLRPVPSPAAGIFVAMTGLRRRRR